MDETTRRVLNNLKNLVDSRKELEEQGLLSPAELESKLMVEEHMKYEITSLMRVAQKKLEDKKREDQNTIAKLTYKLERKIREMNRQKEEDDYRQQVEERYEARMKKEKEEEEKKKKKQDNEEEDEKNDVKTGDDKKEEENFVAADSKNKKKRKKNNKKGTAKSEKNE